MTNASFPLPNPTFVVNSLGSEGHQFELAKTSEPVEMELYIEPYHM